MSEIGSKTINAISNSVAGLLENYEPDLNDAWRNTEDVKITIGVKLEREEGNRISIKTDFSFVKEKVKDQVRSFVTEGQGNLFEDCSVMIEVPSDDPPVISDQRGSNDNAVNM